jgi:hypothetical protein
MLAFASPVAAASPVESGRYTGRSGAGVEMRLRLTTDRHVDYRLEYRYRCTARAVRGASLSHYGRRGFDRTAGSGTGRPGGRATGSSGATANVEGAVPRGRLDRLSRAPQQDPRSSAEGRAAPIARSSVSPGRSSAATGCARGCCFYFFNSGYSVGGRWSVSARLRGPRGSTSCHLRNASFAGSFVDGPENTF